MPFSSLRRRTVNEPLPPQEEHKTPSLFRARSSTVPGLSPRKSLQTLVGSMRKRSGTVAYSAKADSPSPSNKQDVLEEVVYENDERAKVVQTLYRAPGPHTTEALGSYSISSPSHSESPRTFLETLADAIRAPAALFYKEKRQKSENESTVASHDDTRPSSADIKPAPSPTKTLSLKKSVRFKLGKSTINDELRSSPIDIPKPMPALPPMQLATTPLLQCFGRDHPDMIPSGRPRDTPVLKSKITFRQARDRITEDDISDISPLGTPVSDPATPVCLSTKVIEDVFLSRNEEHNEHDESDSPKNYDKYLSSRTVGVISGSTPERRLSSRCVKTTVTPERRSVDTSMATASTNSILERNNDKFSPRPIIDSATASTSELLPDLDCMQLDDSNRTTTESSTHQYDADSEDFLGHSDCAKPSISRGCLVDEKWMKTPTLEDIRERFKGPAGNDSSTDSPLDSTCASAMITPLPGTPAETSPFQLPASAVVGRSPKRPYSPTLFLRNAPWSAELVNSRKRTISEKPVVPRRLAGRFSSSTTAMSDKSGAFLPQRYSEVSLYSQHKNHSMIADRKQIVQESTSDVLWGFDAPPSPFPGRIVSQGMRSPSPALIPLPLSPCRPLKLRPDLCTDDYGLYSFDGESNDSDSNLELPPGCTTYPPIVTCLEAHLKEDGPCPDSNDGGFNIEGAPLNTPEESSEVQHQELGGNLGNELDGYLDATGQYFKMPRLSAEKQLAEAAKERKKIAHSKASESSSIYFPDPDQAAEYQSAAQYLGELSRLSFRPEAETGTEPANRSRATTITSSKCPSVFSAKSSRRSTGQTTDTAEAMKADEVMCKGIV